MRTQVFSVPDISCDMCKNAIEGALRSLAGVRVAAVDVGAGTVSVDFEDTIASDALVAAIEQQGYRVAAAQDDGG
jgi:copper chaperone